MNAARHPQSPEGARTGSRRSALATPRAAAAALLAVLGLLAGCTDDSRTTTTSSSAAQVLEELPVDRAASGEDYDRLEQFGDWADPDGNGCDARNDILARDLTGVVVDDDCRVLSGVLHDPYTGATIDFVRGPATSADVQIDHVVALKNAWITGADRLTRDQRVALANDPLNLQAVDGPTNGDKSASDAAAWLPPAEGYRCEYVARQIAVKAKYQLFVTAGEKEAMAEVLAGCPEQALPTEVPGAEETAPPPEGQGQPSAP
jgi:hypothetical protein